MKCLEQMYFQTAGNCRTFVLLRRQDDKSYYLVSFNTCTPKLLRHM